MSKENWRVWKLQIGKSGVYVVAPSSFVATRAWVAKTGVPVDLCIDETIYLSPKSEAEQTSLLTMLSDRRIRRIHRVPLPGSLLHVWEIIWTMPS